jgi:hypothetical protein
MAKTGRTITLRDGEILQAGPDRGPDIVALVKAARLCVADELTDERIAAELGVGRRTGDHGPEGRRDQPVEAGAGGAVRPALPARGVPLGAPGGVVRVAEGS